MSALFGIGLRLLGIGRRLGSGIASGWRWLTADWRRVMVACVVLWSLGCLAAINILGAQRDRARRDLAVERKAHVQTVVNHRTAAAAAQRRQDANLARVATARAADNERIADAYADEIAAARARADRLRASLAARTDTGGAGKAGMPSAMVPAARASEASGAQGLPGAASLICEQMTIDERLVATEQAIQLDALIDAVEAQMRIPTSPGEAP